MNLTDHPLDTRRVAQRIERFAGIACAKFAAVAEGAALASKPCWS